MTSERLREIVAEHESTTFPECYEDRMLARNTDWESIAATAHCGRGELLEFIRHITKAGCYVEQAAVGDCFYCGVSLVYDSPHHDCPAPALEALRCEAAQPHATDETTRTT